MQKAQQKKTTVSKDAKTCTAGLSKNVKYYYIAVAVVVLGYIILSIGGANSFTSLTLGPIILVAGYLVAIPIALLAGVGKDEGEKGNGQAE
ncbi:MAG: hypothetical protein J7M24_05295 [Candidatus Latescibacteria bacterium]|nr:hypothetical protein [Candidatus Latescibacterota bacterium]